MKNKAAIVAAAAGLVGVVALSAALVPWWLTQQRLRRAAEQRQAVMLELSTLWNRLVGAKRGWCQAQIEPEMTRAKIEEALKDAGAFVDRHPDLPQAWHVRARARQFLGDADAAEKDLKAALRADPEFSPASASLALLKLEAAQSEMLVQLAVPGKHDAQVSREAGEALEKARAAGKTPLASLGLSRADEDDVLETLVAAFTHRHLDRDLPRARAFLEEAQRRSPSEQYCVWLGIWATDPKENIAWQTEALRIMPYCAPALAMRACARALLNDFAAAAEDLSRAMSIRPGWGALSLARGCCRTQTRDLAGAREDLDQAVRLMPDHAAPRAQRAIVRWKFSDAAGALEDANRAIAIDPHVMTAWSLRAAAKLALKDYEGARDDATEALKAGSRHDDLVARGKARLQLGDHRDAVDDFTAALQMQPDDANVLSDRAIAKHRGGDFAGALEDASAAILVNPRSDRAWFSGGAAKKERGDIDGALQDFAKTIELNPDHDLARFQRALIRLKRDNAFGAIDDLTAAIHIQRAGRGVTPSDAGLADLYRERGVARVMASDLDAAIQDLNESLRLSPRSAPALAARAQARAKSDDLRGAIQDWTEALALDPRSGTSYAARGAVYELLGDREPSQAADAYPPAEADYAKALELLDPKLPARTGLKRDLDRIRAKSARLPK